MTLKHGRQSRFVGCLRNEVSKCYNFKDSKKKKDWRVYGKYPEIKVKVFLIILKFSLNQAYRDLMEPLHVNFH